jgi:competence protein ComEA
MRLRLARLALVAITLAVLGCRGDDANHGKPRAAPAILIDLNAATVAELETLPGIGPKRARSIIASRNARGGRFTTVDELLQIDGIGEPTLNQIRGMIVIGPGRDARPPGK